MGYAISVIIPVYNVETYIREAMRSLEKQTIGFEKLQIILIDDCSTDQSMQIIREYESKYDNVLVYQTEKNSGAAGTPRNIGLEHAQAPYVMFLDPDDFYLENACEALYKKICETKAEIVGGRFFCVDADGENPVCGEPNFPPKEIYFEMPRDLMKVIGWMSPIWQRIFDLDYIRKQGILFENGYGEDNVFLNRCFVAGCTLVQIGDYILNYRMQPQSITKSIKKSFFYGYIPCAAALGEILAPYPEALNAKRCIDVNWYMSKIMTTTFGKDVIVEIFRDCKVIFVGLTTGNMDYVIISKLVEKDLMNEAAEYVLKCRECMRIQTEYEGKIRELTDWGNSLDEVIAQQRERICELETWGNELDAVIAQQREIIDEREQSLLGALRHRFKRR